MRPSPTKVYTHSAAAAEKSAAAAGGDDAVASSSSSNIAVAHATGPHKDRTPRIQCGLRAKRKGEIHSEDSDNDGSPDDSDEASSSSDSEGDAADECAPHPPKCTLTLQQQQRSRLQQLVEAMPQPVALNVLPPQTQFTWRIAMIAFVTSLMPSKNRVMQKLKLIWRRQCSTFWTPKTLKKSCSTSAAAAAAAAATLLHRPINWT